MGQDGPPRFDRMFDDCESPSGVGSGKFEDHSHSTEPDRTALIRLHDNRRFAQPCTYPVTVSAKAPPAQREGS
jgi:hypothetical protein